MPRANRFAQPGMVCHLTHRCHNRSFLLGFIAEKKLNREKCWTESIAVGGQEYVGKIAVAIRREHMKPHIEEREDGSWLIRESAADYPRRYVSEAP